ncbi:TetR/AcrR family transcriptional regulator [Streptomyces sp. NPDC005963]|uniref:TetR/AcrR family transcriptional regulator n=1 Tax=Streptomyces sp. NPDC005963 TaxID=3156721 RepID=UPI0033CB0D08
MRHGPLRVDAQRTVDSLLETARVLLRDDPKTPLADIAERANVHRTTLGRYFPSREALVEELLQKSLEAIERRMAQIDTATGDPLEALQQATLAWIRESAHWRASRYAPLGAVPDRGEAPALIKARITELIERGQHEGAIRTDLPPETLYFTWGSLTMAFNALAPDVAQEEVANSILTLLRTPSAR